MAPIADQRGDVRELSTEQPCAAAASQTEPTTSSR
jgi:hypothetical protein